MNSLRKQFQLWSQQQQTGTLSVETSNQQWQLFFYLGFLVWARGGSHPLRRWRRTLIQYRPQTQAQDIAQSEAVVAEGKEYHLLIQWVLQQQLTREEAKSWIYTNTAEILFDLMQQAEVELPIYKTTKREPFDAFIWLINPEGILEQSDQIWRTWCDAGLVGLSPNLSPVGIQLNRIQHRVAANLYQSLAKVLSGERTLRDIAMLLGKEVLPLTQSLIPYIQKGLVKLITIPDLQRCSSSNTTVSNQLEVKAPAVSIPTEQSITHFLIAHIDDNSLELARMEYILTNLGYRFLRIQSPTRAVSTLLEYQPDLIFLDLIMPIANGYEVCSQIRKISQFKNIPIIFLTGNDRIVDRYRAKMVGSTDFISKPIQEEQVIAVIHKHLPALVC